MNGSSPRWWAALVLLMTVGGAVVAQRLGPAARTEAAGGQARSVTWICPHGGGRDWTGSVVIANPGASAVQVRHRGLGANAAAPSGFPVAAGAAVARAVDASERESATVVDVFGGWAAVGWQLRAGGEEHGLGAEPCLAGPATVWNATGMPTTEGERSFLIVANPYAADAVVDVTLFSPDAPPVRDPALIDRTIPAGESDAIAVSGVVPGKATVAATVAAGSGRVAVATLVVSDDDGVRSTVASSVVADSWIVPTGLGAGRSTLSVGVLGDTAARFSGVLRTDANPQPASGLIDVRQVAASTAIYPIIATQASSVDVTAQAPLVVVLSAEGRGIDDAATGGAVGPSMAWVVLPTAFDADARRTVVLVNPTSADAEITVQLLGGADEGALALPTTFSVPAGRTLALPRSVWAAAPGAAVLVRSSGPVVALGASASSGPRAAAYALAMGVPVPAWVVPG